MERRFVKKMRPFGLEAKLRAVPSARPWLHGQLCTETTYEAIVAEIERLFGIRTSQTALHFYLSKHAAVIFGPAAQATGAGEGI